MDRRTKRCVRSCAIRVFRRCGGKQSFFYRLLFLPAQIILCFASIKLLSTPVLASDENTEEIHCLFKEEAAIAKKLTKIRNDVEEIRNDVKEGLEKIRNDVEKGLEKIRNDVEEIQVLCKEAQRSYEDELTKTRNDVEEAHRSYEDELTKVPIDAKYELTKIHFSYQQEVATKVADIKNGLAAIESVYGKEAAKIRNDVEEKLTALQVSHEHELTKVKVFYEHELATLQFLYEQKLTEIDVSKEDELTTIQGSYKEELTRKTCDTRNGIATLQHSYEEKLTKILSDAENELTKNKTDAVGILANIEYFRKAKMARVKVSYKRNLARNLAIIESFRKGVKVSYEHSLADAKRNLAIIESFRKAKMADSLANTGGNLANVTPKSTAKNAHSYFLVSAVVLTLPLIVVVSLLWLLSRRQSCLSRHAEPKLSALAELPQSGSPSLTSQKVSRL